MRLKLLNNIIKNVARSIIDSLFFTRAQSSFLIPRDLWMDESPSLPTSERKRANPVQLQ
jgi:hypothetical protein